jgi:hypothetical protein
VLRSIASAAPAGTVPPGQMGYYAPPRVAGAPAAGPAAPPTGWGKVALFGLLGAAVPGVGVWFALTRLVGADEPTAAGPETPAKPTRPREPVVVSPHPAGTAGPCPEAMATVGEGTGRFCIDLHESPGQGRLPQTGVSLTEAETACGMRGARLCSESEWEQACRGEGAASWPYGDTYRGEPCNTDTGKMGVIAVGGAFPDCKSAVGAFDMSGNVAEWVSGEITKGSSALDRSDGRCSSKKPRSGSRGYSDVGFRCCRDPR